LLIDKLIALARSRHELRIFGRAVLRLLALTLVALAFAAAPASAQLPPPPGSKSANVTALTTLPEPNGVSANFKGNVMYLSTSRGLAIYDITKPEAPQRLSFFPLANFENEDVDTNGDILLISNDPSEGKGILYIFDVRDPKSPKLLSTLDTGLIDSFGLLPYGTGHTASCIQNCKYVYLAGTARGVDIADLTDPAHPKLVGTFAAPEATGITSHDVQVDSSGLAWIVGYNGTAAYDTTDALNPKLVYRTDDTAKSRYVDEPTNDGKSLNDFIHHNSQRMNNGSLASPPAGADPNSESDTALITEEDYTRPTCEGAGQFETWRIGDGGVLHNLDSFVVETDPSRTTLCSAHYFDERGGLVAQGWYEGGTRFLDVTNPSDIKQVGYWIPDKNVTWSSYYAPTDPTGSIVYSIDTTRGVDVIKIDRGKPDNSTPPPGGGTGGSGSGGSPQSQGGAAPNIRLKIGDRRRSVRRGQKVKYTVDVRNGGRAPASGIAVTVDLPTGVARVRGGRKAARGRQVRFTIGQLAPGASKRLKVLTRISRRFRGSRVEISAAATANGDADPRDNFYVDRNSVKAAKKSRASGKSAPTLAEQTSEMPAVIAPELGRVDSAEAERWARTFGGVCRIALSS
jgi:uncharacterized repeat protein (TIGR01451 family)